LCFAMLANLSSSKFETDRSDNNFMAETSIFERYLIVVQRADWVASSEVRLDSHKNLTLAV
jgi:hypothetical protein